MFPGRMSAFPSQQWMNIKVKGTVMARYVTPGLSFLRVNVEKYSIGELQLLIIRWFEFKCCCNFPSKLTSEGYS